MPERVNSALNVLNYYVYKIFILLSTFENYHKLLRYMKFIKDEWYTIILMLW